MRSILLTAVLSLGLSGAFANVICDTKRSLGIDSTTFNFDDTIASCIENFCSTTLTGETSASCESLQLSVTQIGGDALPTAADCTTQFTSIVDQCLIIEGVEGGTAIEYETLYEVHATHEKSSLQERNWSNNDDVNAGLQARARSRGGSRGRTSVSKTRKTKAKKTKTNHRPKAPTRKTSSKGKKKGTHTRKPKNGKKKGTHISKPKNGKKKTTKPKKNSCKAPQAGKGKKGKIGTKGKKTIRDVLESFLPSQLLPRNPTSHGGKAIAGSSSQVEAEACELKVHYKRKGLDNHVIHYRFDTTTGWKTSPSVTKERPRVKNVMEKMKPDGFFDVIAFTSPSPRTYCVGKKAGGTRPAEIVAQAAEAGGQCLVTNGNFFVLGLSKNMEWESGTQNINDMKEFDRFSVGFTSTDPKKENTVNVPNDYNGYYEEFVGTDGSSMVCGPPLKEELHFEKPEMKYWCERTPETTSHAFNHPTIPNLVSTVYAQIPGSLAHASEPNERLVTVIMTEKLKYVFSYTTTDRQVGGLDLNHMRALIDTYLKEFPGTAGIAESKQALNMDGGGSIYVNWIDSRGRQTIIAAGDMKGEKPPSGHRGRRVQTMIRHHAV